jgi:hypothetical protein
MDESDVLVVRFTYSSLWLDETADNPSILSTCSSSSIGTGCCHFRPTRHSRGVERFMGVADKTHYQVGAGFRAVDMSSPFSPGFTSTTWRARAEISRKSFSWLREEYLAEEFDAVNFSFRSSSRGASYLERVRHLFADEERHDAVQSLGRERGTRPRPPCDHLGPGSLQAGAEPAARKAMCIQPRVQRSPASCWTAARPDAGPASRARRCRQVPGTSPGTSCPPFSGAYGRTRHDRALPPKVRGLPCASRVGFLRGGTGVPPRLGGWESRQAPGNLLRVSLARK